MTADVVDTLERKRGIPVTRAQREALWQTEIQFLRAYWEFTPPDALRIELGSEMVATAMQLLCTDSRPAVSLDRIYGPRAEYRLEVTRTAVGDRTEIRARPGFPPLEEQVDCLPREPLRVLDSGIFTGDTLVEILALIERKSTVADVVVGLADAKALARLQQKYPVRAAYAFPFLEWIELRDLVGLEGRTLDNGSFVPYWENITTWASIPSEQAGETKALCKQYAKRIQKILEGKL